MVNKPFMIAPTTGSSDYSGFVRRAMSKIQDNSFADALEAESRPVRQRTGRLDMPPAHGGRQAAVKNAAAQDIRTAQPMALDSRSLSILQRMDHPRTLPAKSPQNTRQTEADGTQADRIQSPATPKEGLGSLSARFESGTKGIAAIGYDRNGGTSYGKYQISSRQGTFQQFLNYLQAEAPDIAEKLGKAGNANTGSRKGGVPDAWQTIAATEPERFEKLQEGFIRHSHYDQAEPDVKRQLGVETLSRPLQEVLWSTAVQHGPTGAVRLFEQTVQKLNAAGKDPQDEKALIDTLYSLRKGQFPASTPRVQTAVHQRFDVEKKMALAMLNEHVAVT